MGAKLIAALTCLLLLVSCGPSPIEYVPYTLQEDGTQRLPESCYTSHQLLQWCEGPSSKLVWRELYFYDGSLYALSNFRRSLLNHGYVEEVREQSSSVLDILLTSDAERVRLIYQSSGTIRIIMENPDGLAHILLEGI